MCEARRIRDMVDTTLFEVRLLRSRFSAAYSTRHEQHLR